MSDDEKLLRALGGANFGPDASLTLPSGRRLDSDEAQAFTSLYATPGVRPPEGDLVNVGELLAEVATACAAVAGATTPTSQVTDSSFAFQRLSNALSAASKAFAHIRLFVPKEPDSGS